MNEKELFERLHFGLTAQEILFYTDKIFNYFKRTGIVKFIREYYPYADEEDIKSDIKVAILEAARKYDPTKCKYVEPYLLQKSKEVFTKYINLGAQEIERIVTIDGKEIKISEKEFYKLRKNLKYLDNIKSVRNTISIEQLTETHRKNGYKNPEERYLFAFAEDFWNSNWNED